jgi:hypothetical protein
MIPPSLAASTASASPADAHKLAQAASLGNCAMFGRAALHFNNMHFSSVDYRLMARAVRLLATFIGLSRQVRAFIHPGIPKTL